MNTGHAVGVGVLRAGAVGVHRRRRLAVTLVAPVLLAAAGGVGQARAALPSNCAQSGTTVSCTFPSTGAPDQTFQVPAHISSVHVVAVGAPGGATGPRVGGPGQAPGPPGGAGAVATGTLKVTGGQTLYVEVGGPGGAGYDTSAPGFNGGGAGDPRTSASTGSGGGGGASDVRLAPYSAGLSPDRRLLIAGGGGGSGTPLAINVGTGTGYIIGGAGGSAGRQGGDGRFPCLNPPGAGGGGPGTASSGGAGGAGQPAVCYQGDQPGLAGGHGSLGQGGGGSTKGSGGGAGGGGLYGGGQGGEGTFNTTDDLFDGSGGGGGGGSSLVPAGGSVTADTTGLPPQVTISYTAASGFGSTAPVRPKLHLAISGPHAVRTGQIVRYRITLSRTQPLHHHIYPVKNVRVSSKHAGRRVGHWLVSRLPPGQSRILRLRVAVPRTARGRFCITANASARNARAAAVRDCAPVNPAAPIAGLG